MNARTKRMLDKLPVNICIGFAFGVAAGLAARWIGTFLWMFWIYVVISSICAYSGFTFKRKEKPKAKPVPKEVKVRRMLDKLPKHICIGFAAALVAGIATNWGWCFLSVFWGYVLISSRLVYTGKSIAIENALKEGRKRPSRINHLWLMQQTNFTTLNPACQNLPGNINYQDPRR